MTIGGKHYTERTDAGNRGVAVQQSRKSRSGNIKLAGIIYNVLAIAMNLLFIVG